MKLFRSRLSLWLTALFIMSFLLACQSTPEEIEEVPEEEVQEETVESAPPPDNALTDEEIAAARKALQRAQVMGANDFFPSEYRTLAGNLNQAIETGKTDPDQARSELAVIIQEANALYDKTFIARRDSYLAKMKQSDTALIKIEADKFAPFHYSSTVELYVKAMGHFESMEVMEAVDTANETLTAQVRVYYNVKENKDYIAILRRDTENYLSDAENNEAYEYAAEELALANEYYTAGIEAYQAYDLAISEDLLSQARHNALEAARISMTQKRLAETDRLLSSIQSKLETASQKRILDDQGEVVEAKPWKGEDYLTENPLLNLTPEPEDYSPEDSRLNDYNDPVEQESEGPEMIEIPIEEEGTQVQGDEQTADFLGMAQTLWEKGVQARNQEKYDLADEYFNQARAYIEAYEAAAIDFTYTVVYREVATDCLWRIAEYTNIYDNPFLWPKIWRANKKIIQNPDLIYPGQVLVIPPQ